MLNIIIMFITIIIVAVVAAIVAIINTRKSRNKTVMELFESEDK